MRKRQLEQTIKRAQTATGNQAARLRITYAKQAKPGTGPRGGSRAGVVSRVVRPYRVEVTPQGTILWATDTVHGAGRIHKFYGRGVLSAAPEGGTFRPVWDVET